MHLGVLLSTSETGTVTSAIIFNDFILSPSYVLCGKGRPVVWQLVALLALPGSSAASR